MLSKTVVFSLFCEEPGGFGLYLFLLLGKQLHGVCLSFSGSMYFTKEKTHTCNPFIPIFLTVDQTLWFSYCTNAASFSNTEKKNYAILNRASSLLHRQGKIISQHSFTSMTQLYLIFKTLYQTSVVFVCSQITADGSVPSVCRSTVSGVPCRDFQISPETVINRISKTSISQLKNYLGNR